MTPTFTLSTGSYSVMKFPSGELQVTLDVNSIKNLKQDILVTGSILSSDHLIELCQLMSVLNYYIDRTKCSVLLLMPYCAYSRQDRICNVGESFSLKVFANILNSLNFTQIIIYDNHSDVATALLDNCSNIPVSDLLDLNPAYNYFISPDAGSNKKVQACSTKFMTPMIRADKLRDTSTGRILETIVYATPEQLDGQTVLIIDDICQNGRTFIELAKAIHAISPTCTIHLFVTHGFFSAGIQPLVDAGISHIYTTGSVCTVSHSNLAVLDSF